jgi:enoyl-[acyl-carrier protein] reductase II
MQIKNRITGLLGVEYPIVQAPMGWIARSQLASAVCNAGGMGIIETSSGELDAVKGEIEKMRALTTKPFGVNVALAFVRDPGIVNFIIDQGVKFVTTSAGDPQKIVGPLKEAGLTVFHVVPSLKTALRAVDAASMVLSWKEARAADSRIRERSRAWSCCRWSVRKFPFP